MTDAERYQKYVKEYCSNCKNNNKDLCEIRIFTINGVTTTKCVYYEKDKNIKGYKQPLGRTANQAKPLMRFTQNY